MIFVDPKNDVAFKKIFGSENKKGILKCFLNAMLGFFNSPKEIVDIRIMNPYQAPKLYGLKETILDIRAVDKRNINYIIEMQVYHTKAFEKRVQYYVSKTYHMQLDKAESYPKLNQVIFLGFLDFTMFKNPNYITKHLVLDHETYEQAFRDFEFKNPNYITKHLVLDHETYEQAFRDFEFNFVELPKFNKSLDDIADDNIRDKWIYFVKNTKNLEMIPQKLLTPIEIVDAFQIANQMTWTKAELDVYDSEIIYIQDQKGQIEYAREKGLEIGMEKGLEKGKKQNAIETAKKLKTMGLSIEQIAEATELSISEIEALD